MDIVQSKNWYYMCVFKIYDEQIYFSNRGASKSDLLSLNKGNSKSKTDLISLYLGDYYTDEGNNKVQIQIYKKDSV